MLTWVKKDEARQVFGGEIEKFIHKTIPYGTMQTTLTPEQRMLRDAEDAPTVVATTKKQILNARFGTVIEAPDELWEELGMSVPDDPSTYPQP